LKNVLRPKYLLIPKFKKNITHSGRRWKPHGSSKEGSGKEGSTQEAGGKEGSTQEEVMQ